MSEGLFVGEVVGPVVGVEDCRVEFLVGDCSSLGDALERSYASLDTDK
jgi:hypothetical protein